MLDAIGAASVDEFFTPVPDRRFVSLSCNCPGADRDGGGRPIGAAGGANAAFRAEDVFLGAGSYRHFVPAAVGQILAQGRVLHRLHPVPAGSRPGHAAGHLRISESGRVVDRHGRRQRVDVRRRDSARRGRIDDGVASTKQARACRRVDRPSGLSRTSCRPISRDSTSISSRRPSRDRPSSPRPRTSSAHLGTTWPASSSSTRISTVASRIWPHSRTGPCARRRAGRQHLSRSPSVCLAAGRARRRRRRGRGPIARRRAKLRWPVRWTAGGAPGVCSPDARPAGRDHARQRRQARICADAADSRTTHPAREGDVKHLHEPGTDGHRRHGPHGDARSRGACEVAQRCYQNAHYLAERISGSGLSRWQ